MAPKEGVEIINNEGFLCHIQLHSKLDVPRDAAYQMVVDPDNYRYFRNVTECTHRKVVHNDGKGRQRVEVDHRSEWRFLWHHGSFTTSLLVEQDDNARVMAFRLRRPGFMKSFEGFWRMEDLPGDKGGTYAVLHQNLLPCVSAPGLNWLVTKVCRAQIENMLKDLKQEIRRVNKGDPIPAEQQQKMEKGASAQPDANGHQLDAAGSDGTPEAADGLAPNAAEQHNGTETPLDADDWPLLRAAEHNMIAPSTKKPAGDKVREPPPVAIQ